MAGAIIKRPRHTSLVQQLSPAHIAHLSLRGVMDLPRRKVRGKYDFGGGLATTATFATNRVPAAPGAAWAAGRRGAELQRQLGDEQQLAAPSPFRGKRGRRVNAWRSEHMRPGHKCPPWLCSGDCDPVLSVRTAPTDGHIPQLGVATAIVSAWIIRSLLLPSDRTTSWVRS
jgi:hypothetical protein